MDLKKNRPQLTDINFLQSLNPPKQVSITPINNEPSIVHKCLTSMKIYLIEFIKKHIFGFVLISIIICFLIYRFIKYGDNDDEIVVNKSNDTDIYNSVLDELKQEQAIITGNKMGRKHKKKKKQIVHEMPVIKSVEEMEETKQLIDHKLEQYMNDGEKVDLTVINSSSYAPYNLPNMSDFHPV